MRLTINALATTNQSGGFVISGHVKQWLEHAEFDLAVSVLCHAENRQAFEPYGDAVECVVCPDTTTHWRGRALWERKHLSAALRDQQADVMLALSGMCVAPSLVPVVPYAMNPWALVPGVAQRPAEKLKAALQRRAYAKTVKHAAGMAFLSGYMQDAYRTNAGQKERRSEVVYIGLEDDVVTGHRDLNMDAKFAARHIISASAMAPHKGAETLVRAMAHDAMSRDCRLTIAGGWPDAGYEARIAALILELGLTERVAVIGYQERDDLLALYRDASVFCLMSECESFGIPSVEAQAFGNPVVTSDRCAMPEVCGAGGRYATPGDVVAVATTLAETLADRSAWDQLAAAALENTQRFNWNEQARKLYHLLESCMNERVANS